MEYLLSLLIGVSLSATSGFRIFVPLLVLSIFSLAGWVELTPAFSWLGTYPALAALSVATILEITAYFFPYMDNLLAAVAAPAGVLAGVLITAAVLVDFHPMLAWALAIVTGGGAALGGSVVSNLMHTGSTAVSDGAANPVLSAVESLFAVINSFLALIIPVLAFLMLLVLALIVFYIYRAIRNKRRGRFKSRKIFLILTGIQNLPANL
ncbi:MAG TPA: DUF4126 domain-containing protein [Firmicutes bacterium]|nr:DUF4126 domain-containing protein [Bacillota bacterium]